MKSTNLLPPLRHWLAIIALALAPCPPGHTEPATREQFIQQVSATHGFDAETLTALLDQAQLQPAILKAIAKPSEHKPWHEYYPRFINDARIRDGARFVAMHRAALREASARYGVPAEIITAIIGVETHYGKVTGTFKVLDALVTLAFNYPPRADFFQRELAEFLLLTREQQLDAQEVEGSYAGAMGIGQFMPSSYRKYAVDMDNDGQANLWQTVDSIGSIAHYLRAYGWQHNQPIVAATESTIPLDEATLATFPKQPTWRAGDFRQYGLLTATDDDTPAYVITLETEPGPQYWLGLTNFYVLTRYNRSHKYAMAVQILAEHIRAAPGTQTWRGNE